MNKNSSKAGQWLCYTGVLVTDLTGGSVQLMVGQTDLTRLRREFLSSSRSEFLFSDFYTKTVRETHIFHIFQTESIKIKEFWTQYGSILSFTTRKQLPGQSRLILKARNWVHKPKCKPPITPSIFHFLQK